MSEGDRVGAEVFAMVGAEVLSRVGDAVCGREVSGGSVGMGSGVVVTDDCAVGAAVASAVVTLEYERV
jgi:hypothetical protein